MHIIKREKGLAINKLGVWQRKVQIIEGRGTGNWVKGLDRLFIKRR